MLEAILGILGTAASWINSSQANKNMQSTLGQIKSQNVIPPSLIEGKNILEEQATTGLPGYETMKEEEETQFPDTINRVKDSVTSGDLMKLVMNLYTKQNQNLRTLSISDAEAKMENRQRLATYLSGPMAEAEEGQLSNLMNLEMAGALSKQESASQSNQYLTNILKGAGKVGDTDWSDLIAGLSTKQKTPKGGKAGDVGDLIFNPETGVYEMAGSNLT